MNRNLEKTIYDAARRRGVLKEELMTYEQQESLFFERKLINLRKKVLPLNLSVNVNPLNKIQENLEKFGERYYPLIKENNLEFKFIGATFAKDIELIKCEPAEMDATLREIDERGYVSVPSPFILGLGVENPYLLKEYYGCIISLDSVNLLRDMYPYSGFLFLDLCTDLRLGLAKSDGKFSDHWRFAVVSKDVDFMRIKNCA